MQFEWSNKRKFHAIHEYDGMLTPWCTMQHCDGTCWGSLQTIVLTGLDKTGHLVACIAAHRELDLKTIARVSENKRVELLSLDKLEPLTGYVMRRMFTDWNEEEISNLHRASWWAKTIRICGKTVSIRDCTTWFYKWKLTQATVFENHPDEVEAWEVTILHINDMHSNFIP